MTDLARRRRHIGRIVVMLLAALAVAAPAHAQWYLASFTGADRTLPADVELAQPAIGRTLTFHDVTFDAKPFQSPQYYGARIGHLFSHGLGLEVEFLHIKVIARTDRTVHITGSDLLGPVDVMAPMNVVAQRYAMTHGLNYLLGNLVWRVPLGGRLSGTLRMGAGQVIAGVDSVVDHTSVQGYQEAGPGAQVGAGLDLRVAGPLSLTLEYKLTASRPKIIVSNGTGRMDAVSHHLAAGFALGFSRP